MPNSEDRKNAQSLPGRQAKTPGGSSEKGLDIATAWTRPTLCPCEGSKFVPLHHKIWTSVSAVICEMDVPEGGMDVNIDEPFTRLLVPLAEIGGRVRGWVGHKQEAATRVPNRMYLLPPGPCAWAFGERLSYVRYLSLQFTEQSLSKLVDGYAIPDAARSPWMGFTNPHMFALVRLFELECREPGVAEPLLGDGLSLSLIALLARDNGPAVSMSGVGGLTARQLKIVITYLEAHLAEPISPYDLAQLLQLSTAYFHRAFKLATGAPPHMWLTQMRIRRAQELLLSRETSIAEIAQASGFASHAQFTRVFTRRVGASPRAWRTLANR
jgi:AraC-like DNA-binding protein